MMSSGLDSERVSALGGHASLSAQHAPETSAWTWSLGLHPRLPLTNDLDSPFPV